MAQIQTFQPKFDNVADAFTECLEYALNWRENYLGFTNSDKVAAAIIDLREVFKAVSACHEMKGLL